MPGCTNAGVVTVVCLLCLAPVVGAVGAVGASGANAAGATTSAAQDVGSVTVTSAVLPEQTALHRNFTVQATVNNTGESAAEQTIRVERANDKLWSTIATHTVTVPANTETTVSFNASLHRGEASSVARLRVNGLDSRDVDLRESSAIVDRPRSGEWVADSHLSPGENTTVSLRLRSRGFNDGEYVLEFRGGTYDGSRSRVVSRMVTDAEPFQAVDVHPRFDAGGTHAVTANGQFLDFVTVSSPNVSVTSVESLPDVVYEGTRESLNVTLENTGGQTEQFAVTTSQTLDGESVPTNADTRVVSLAPGETRTVERTVAFYQEGQQTVSVNNGSGQTVTVEHPVSVDDYGVAGSAYTYQNVTLTATVTNHRSTKATRNVEFSLWKGSGESPDVSLNETKAVTLAGGATETVTYRALVETPGTYTARVGDGAASTVEVAENPISLTEMSAPANASAGSQVDVTVTLANGGAKDTHRTVTVGSFPWFASQNVSVPAGETRTVTFSRTVTTRGFVPFSVRGNSSIGAIVRVPTPNLVVSVPVEERYDPLSRLAVSAQLNNTGPTSETYQIPISIEHDEFAGVNKSLMAWETIAAGGLGRTYLSYETSQPGNYTLTARGHLVREFTVTKPVETVTAGVSNATVNVSEPFTFNGTYRNPTDERQYVAITFDGVDQTAATVPANETTTVSRTFTSPVAGNYTLVVNGERYDVTVVDPDADDDQPTDGGDAGDGEGSGDESADDEGSGNENSNGENAGDDGGGGTDGSSSNGGGSSGGGSSGGGADSSDSSSDSGESSDSTADNSTGAGAGNASAVVTVNATQTANGTAVAEVSASANQTVAIELGGGNATDGDDTAVTSVNVSLAANETFSVAVSSSDDPPASLPDTGTDAGSETGSSVVEYVNISHPDLPDDAIASASFTVTVGADRLAEMDAAPDDVVVYRYDDGWESVSTTHLGERGDAHAFEVESPGLSVFAVGVDSDADDALTTTTQSTTTQSATTGQSMTSTATTTDPAESTTEDSGSTSASTGTSTPGFGVGHAVLALLAGLATGFAARRR